MNSISEASFSLSFPGLIGNLGEQSNGVSVVGACSASAFPRARKDLVSEPAGASCLVLEVVERKMTNTGEGKK
jgi:hypothetical protein